MPPVNLALDQKSLFDTIHLHPVLHGARFLIVLGSYFGKLDIYEHMRSLGCTMVVMDGPDHWAQHYVELGLFEAFLEIAPDNLNLSDALAVAKVYPKPFDAIITFDEYATRLTAGLAQALNLPGHPPAVVELNKFEVRQKCQQAGLPGPRFFQINGSDDLTKATWHVGFPAVLKPVQGASSFDVFRVESLDGLQARYDAILNEREMHPRDTPFNSGDSDESWLVWQHGFTMVLEEYLDGDEYDIDCLLSGGELVYASVTGEKPQPRMIETGARLPALCPVEHETALIDMAHKTLKVLGYSNGVFHVEAKYTSRGPRLIEVNARMGGGPIHLMNRRVWGVDLIEQYLLTSLGLPIRPHKRAPQTYLSSVILVAPFTGIATRDNCLDHLNHHPDVIFCKTYISAGEQVNGPEEHVPGWLGEVIVQGNTRAEADWRLNQIIAGLEIPLKPVVESAARLATGA